MLYSPLSVQKGAATSSSVHGSVCAAVLAAPPSHSFDCTLEPEYLSILYQQEFFTSLLSMIFVTWISQTTLCLLLIQCVLC